MEWIGGGWKGWGRNGSEEGEWGKVCERWDG